MDDFSEDDTRDSSSALLASGDARAVPRYLELTDESIRQTRALPACGIHPCLSTPMLHNESSKLSNLYRGGERFTDQQSL